MSANPFAKQWAQFKASTPDHSLSVLHSDGLYRHLRMAAPNTGIWHWDVVTWPGHLCVDGDIGDGLVFSCDPDMIEFFRAGLAYTYSDGAPQISVGYWAEKLSRGAKSVKTYSPDVFLRHVRDALIEAACPEETQELLDGAGAVSESEYEAREWLKDERRMFGSDAFWEWDLSDWDHHFLLSCYAIAATVKAANP